MRKKYENSKLVGGKNKQYFNLKNKKVDDKN